MQRIVYDYATEQEWLELRKQDITSTVMSALLGLSSYKTKYEIWQEKKNGFAVDFVETERMKWGNRLEAVIAEGIAEETGWSIQPFKSYIRLIDYGAGSSFDFEIIHNKDREGKKGILEIKNVDSMIFKQNWIIEDGVVIEAPPYIEIQAMFQLFVSGYDYITIGAFVGGNKIHYLTREPDAEMFELFKSELNAFEESLASNTPPEIDWIADAEFISQLYKVVTPGRVMNANNDAAIQQAVENYIRAGQDEKIAKQKKDAAKAFLLTHIGDHEKVISDNFTISAGYIGPCQMNYLRNGYRMFKITPKGVLKNV